MKDKNIPRQILRYIILEYCVTNDYLNYYQNGGGDAPGPGGPQKYLKRNFSFMNLNISQFKAYCCFIKDEV